MFVIVGLKDETTIFFNLIFLIPNIVLGEIVEIYSLN